jgi:imidazolonepropionase-like amidohydrolase
MISHKAGPIELYGPIGFLQDSIKSPTSRIQVQQGMIVGLDVGVDDHSAASVDCRDLTLLPGFIDAHSHLGVLTMQFGLARSALETAIEISRNAWHCLQEGFTTVRDLGGIDGSLPRAIDSGRMPGPRVLPSVSVLTQTGGHADRRLPYTVDSVNCCGSRQPDGLPGLTEFAIVCDGPEAVRFAARTAFRQGARQLKMCLSGGIVSHSDRITDTQFDLEEIRAAVREARVRDTYVTAHAFSDGAIRNAIAGGCRCIEHGSFASDQTLAEMAAAGVWLVPTLSTPDMIRARYGELGIPSQVLDSLPSIEKANAIVVAKAMQAGVRLGMGSDLIGTDQTNRGHEIALRARIAGCRSAVESATAANAELLGIADRTGRLEVGLEADVVGVAGDVDDPDTFEDPTNVRFVLSRGSVVKDLDARVR